MATTTIKEHAITLKSGSAIHVSPETTKASQDAIVRSLSNLMGVDGMYKPETGTAPGLFWVAFRDGVAEGIDLVAEYMVTASNETKAVVVVDDPAGAVRSSITFTADPDSPATRYEGDLANPWHVSTVFFGLAADALMAWDDEVN